MTFTEKYDKLLTGLISGFLLPLLTGLIIFFFAKGNPGLREWFHRIAEADVITHMISLSVFSNLLIFLLFNHFDMLKAAKGVLGITVFWAALVFGVKILL